MIVLFDRNFSRSSIVGVCLCLLTACAATGDPNSGGIFWSEKKNQERVEEKEREATQLEQGNNELKSEKRTLEKQKTIKQGQLGAIEFEIAELTKENERLQGRVQQLMALVPSQNEEISRALANIARLDEKRRNAISKDRKEYQSALDEQNRSLHQAIMLLLE